MTQQPPSPKKGFDPLPIAAVVGLYARALVIIVLWTMIAVLGLGAGYAVIRIVLWGADTVLRGLGIGHE